jgi:3-isopropylmalate dehydrogenase
MSAHRIALIGGDGIGPEVVDAAVEVLDAAAARAGFALAYERYEAGAGLYRRTGESISAADMEAIGRADAILLGACGLPEVRKPDGTEPAPQIDIREHYGLFGGPAPGEALPRRARTAQGARIDLLIIRENTRACSPGATIRSSPATRA